jgi:hypothetical protein
LLVLSVTPFGVRRVLFICHARSFVWVVDCVFSGSAEAQVLADCVRVSGGCYVKGVGCRHAVGVVVACAVARLANIAHRIGVGAHWKAAGVGAGAVVTEARVHFGREPGQLGFDPVEAYDERA